MGYDLPAPIPAWTPRDCSYTSEVSRQPSHGGCHRPRFAGRGSFAVAPTIGGPTNDRVLGALALATRRSAGLVQQRHRSLESYLELAGSSRPGSDFLVAREG